MCRLGLYFKPTALVTMSLSRHDRTENAWIASPVAASQIDSSSLFINSTEFENAIIFDILGRQPHRDRYKR